MGWVVRGACYAHFNDTTIVRVELIRQYANLGS